MSEFPLPPDITTGSSKDEVFARIEELRRTHETEPKVVDLLLELKVNLENGVIKADRAMEEIDRQFGKL